MPLALEWGRWLLAGGWPPDVETGGWGLNTIAGAQPANSPPLGSARFGLARRPCLGYPAM